MSLPSRRRLLGIAAGPARDPMLSAETVEERARFLIAALRKRPGVQAYTVPGKDLTVLIRHDNVQDGFVLREVFGRIDSYAVPASVRGHLGDVRKIVDLGGNIGLTAIKFLREFPTAELVAVEADPANLPVLEGNLAINGLASRAQVIAAAAFTESGTIGFAAGRAGESRIADPDDPVAIEVPTIDIFPELADADLLKMDIEGGEWPILTDARFADTGLKALCMEYHTHMSPDASPSAAVIRSLHAAGFEVVENTDHGVLGFLWATRL